MTTAPRGAEAALSLGLVERFDGFAYDYRMRCDCGAAVDVTAETYHGERSQARVPCGHCDGEVHFGPGAALVRDEHDAALDDAAVSRLAWYHTSPGPDWPSADYRAQAEAIARQAAKDFHLDVDELVDLATTKALHLGTYEAAIENMLRRMRDQDDGASKFFLYRVAVQVDPARINPGYRDENDDNAAQLGIRDLDDADLDAVRYLNVYEATGSLSLAVRPECITAVQCLPIPVAELVLPTSAELSARLDELAAARAELDRVQETLPKLDPFELLHRLVADVPDPEGIAEQVENVCDKGYALSRDLNTLLIEYMLKGVSPAVAHDVCAAVGAWRDAVEEHGIRAYADRFAQVAALLTRAREVVEMIARQPWRAVTNA